MGEPFLPEGAERPDFYIAAMGRSGSTMIANWLTSPPDRLVFVEPSFLSLPNTRLLRIQLEAFGLGPTGKEWCLEGENAASRFARLMAPRLAGRKWAVKEVLCTEHLKALDRLHPRLVLITVRNIVDVALSFFEKHRLQDNLTRFSDQWVVDYCTREAAGLVDLREELKRRSIPFQIVRYEDFTRSEDCRDRVATFLGWPGGGSTLANLDRFDRSFEADRHGSAVSPRNRRASEREVDESLVRLAEAIGRQCREYQHAFGYISDNYLDVNDMTKLVLIQ
jgi:sulfotransferase family protein